MYLEATGQPDISPESSSIHAAAATQIFSLVEHTMASSQNTYNILRERVHSPPYSSHPYFQDKAEQCLNEIAAELSHGDEDILELTVKWFAQTDPLLSSRLGRMIRRVVPSAEQQAMKQISSLTKRRIDEILKCFLQEIS